ncbi:putative ester cyclase [Ruegeria denitrificans]|uniref:Putative ester cyclase n=2 Tax=Ruegeria denitrificans TaxID=1715692 RepID=A0A0P1IH61_9RHOB|nr:putative ester cyclase [Ruegeria denitrificans]
MTRQLTGLAARILTLTLLLTIAAGGNAMAQQNDNSATKNLSRQAVEMWAADSTIDQSIFADGYQNHQAPLATGGTGSVDLATWVDIVEGNHKAFPDLKVEIFGQIAEGDRVSTHWRFFGTQKGSYLGVPASNRPVNWTGVQIDRIADGKIAESWVVWDYFTLRQELEP